MMTEGAVKKVELVGEMKRRNVGRLTGTVERTNAHQVSQSELMAQYAESYRPRQTGLAGPADCDPAPSTLFCTQRRGTG